MANCANHPETAAAVYCRTCGKPLCEHCRRDVQGVVYCEPCIATRLDSAPAAAPAPGAASVRRVPNPTLAAFLGFIPGVGAVYNGQYQKGLVHLLMLPAIIILANANEYFALLFIAYFPYMALDAYATAKAMERGEPLPDFLGLTTMFGTKPPSATDPIAATTEPAPGSPGRADHAPVGAFIMIGLGCLFLLNTMGLWHIHIGRLVAPLFLIGFGSWLAFRRLQRR